MTVHLDDLPAAVKRVARTATQPGASGLLTYGAFLDRVLALSAKPRVHVEWIGKSRMGRLIPSIVISADVSPAALERSRRAAAELAAPAVVHDRPGHSRIVRPRKTEIPTDAALPVLMISGNYGMEASQLEAMLELAEQLADDTSPEVSAALEKIAAIIVPTVNPDGREIGIEEWEREPLGPALRSAGNFYEVQILREYLHQVEPESAAVAKLIRTWNPFLAYEVHEDAVGLGWGSPEACLAPPTGPAGGPGHGGMVDMPARPGENDPRLHEEQRRYGRAIAEIWRKQGYHLLHQDDGEHGWPVWPGYAPEGLTTQPETRFTRSMAVRGVVAFITESCRIPGSQTWEDRNGQKSTAGHAILHTAREHIGELVDLVGSVADRAVKQGLEGDSEFFLIPLNQDPFILRRASSILRAHDIQAYEADAGSLGRSIVVPLAQPLGPTVSVLLDFDEGRHQTLASALGLQVIASRTLVAAELAQWAKASLTPFVDVPPVTFPWIREQAFEKVITFDNTHQAPTLVNRVLASPGGRVSWKAGLGGGFVAQFAGDALGLHDLTLGLDVSVRRAAAADMDAGTALKPVRVGVYRGQGITRSLIEGNVGRIRKFLTEWEFPFIQVSVFDLTPATLANIDVLIVPEGLADEILDRPLPDYVWHRYPWALDEPVKALETREADALRDWIRAGGHYIGIDAGGGLLATRPYLNLIDAEVTATNLGVGLVELALDNPGDPLFDGIPALRDAAGIARPGKIGAYYHTNPWFAEPGGCVFSVGAGARSLANYAATLPVDGVSHIRPIEAFTEAGGKSAIATTSYGDGAVTVFGVQPAYRTHFLSTARMIANAIFKHGRACA